MNKIIETIKNIWRIEDLRSRILVTILFVAIYRFGSTVVLPGIDPSELAQLQAPISRRCSAKERAEGERLPSIHVG